ncbi:hypothetical protein NKH99_07960 [Mesorhizobium sp. M0854]|uniref:hypothetical protein n=1 Tax=Mesorhizobium sp. M0854 TaxID=2957013 RepID=UPI00333A5EE9
MAIIVMTWQNPSDQVKAVSSDKRAAEWRNVVLKQKGIVEYNAFSGISTGKDMAVDTFRSSEDAAAFLGSKDFSAIVSEMRSLGVTEIDVNILDQHPDVKSALRPA